MEPMRCIWRDAYKVFDHRPGGATSWGRPPSYQGECGRGKLAFVLGEDLGLSRKHIYARDPHPEEDQTREEVIFKRLWNKLVNRTRRHRNTGSSDVYSEYVSVDEMLASYSEG